MKAVRVDGFRGEATGELAVDDPRVDLAAAVRRLADPGAARATLHWGRNYLYTVELDLPGGRREVVVKLTRERGWRARLTNRRLGSRSERAFRIATRLASAGIATAPPLVWAEDRARGVSLFVTERLAGRIEARAVLRARNAGREREELPQIDAAAFLRAAAVLARRLHDAGVWHRDFSVGNLLILPGARPEEIAEVALIDLDRARVRGRVPLGERMRDLARLPLERAEDRALLLSAYFGAAPSAWARLRYETARRGFHGRHRWKNRLRALGARLKPWLFARGAHPHIPEAPAGAGSRERIVWDRLSDQPHSHASRLERALIRISDLPDHARSLAALAGAWPRVRRAERALEAKPPRPPFDWPGVGVALRPWPADPEALLEAFFALGVPHALVRLHPWSTDPAEQRSELELARELAGAGVELAFALPQSRELVREPARWAAAIERIAEQFTPLGHTFQLGQAINRSKWGVWSYGEFLELAGRAAEILRRKPGVELVGPGVIDFEAHATAMVLNRSHPTLRFDALASLLYVDRRGAPENRQLGYDSEGKVRLLAAIAETSRLVGRRRQWITEVNWPLAEGPHSPAGRSVAVDEERQADYLARFDLMTLGSGLVERVFWWQLVAKGYGLIDPQADGALRRRPSYVALAALARLVPAGSTLDARLPAPAGAYLYRFTTPKGIDRVAGWSAAGPLEAALPFRPARAFDRGGAEIAPPPGEAVALGASVVYFDAP